MPLEPEPNPPAASIPNRTSFRAWLRGGGWRSLAFGAVGAVAGGTYAQLIGCRTGGCAILSNVGSATMAGGLIGLTFGWPGPAKKT
jgi:hypothetical protein